MNRITLALIVANEARGVVSVAYIVKRAAKVDASALWACAALVALSLAFTGWRKVRLHRRIERRLNWKV